MKYIKYRSENKSIVKSRSLFFNIFSLFFLVISLFFTQSLLAKTINIFSLNNGRGLERDRQVLKAALENLGHTVREKELWDLPNSSEPQVDINISFEFIVPAWLSYAQHNWFIPNPECYFQKIPLLDEVDLILCRTRQAENIFQSLKKKTYFLGFTSRDFYDQTIEKNYFTSFHLAGTSPLKGSTAIVDLWRGNLSLPKLVIVWNNGALNQPNVDWKNQPISEEDLHHFQNACGIHLCPSSREGYGHYIMEGLAAGAVVITTDAPPMNEFITDARCLVPYQRCSAFNLGMEYFIHRDDLADTINRLMQLPQDELKKIGDNNRSLYLEKTQEFHKNLVGLMQTIGD